MRIILLLVLALTALSCEREIDFPAKEDSARLFLECFPTNGNDTSFIRLTAAVPIAEFPGTRELTGVKVEFFLNHKPVPAVPYSTENGINVYYAKADLSAGNSIKVKASANNIPAVESETSIPPDDLPEIKMTRELGNKGTLRHSFSFSGSVNKEKQYYGITIEGLRKLETEYSDPAIESEVTSCNITYDYIMSSSIPKPDNIIEDKPTIVQCNVNGKTMAVFEDDGGKTTEYVIYLEIPYTKDRYDVIDVGYRTFRRTLYKVTLYRLSKEAYEYLNPYYNRFLLGSGLLPPFIGHSNVTSGYGMMYGMASRSTEWLANL